MPTTRTEYQIFLSTPAGLESERDTLRAEIQEYNDLHARPRALSFTLRSWERVPPGVGRPQALINKDISQSDYLILILHDRWGSPTGEGCYTSGSLEELARAIECLKNPSLPMRDIAIFFKRVDFNQTADAGPQLSQVLRFRQVLTNTHEALYGTFESNISFEHNMRSLLSEWARDCELRKDKSPKNTPAISEWIRSERSDKHQQVGTNSAAEGSSSELKQAAALTAESGRDSLSIPFSRADSRTHIIARIDESAGKGRQTRRLGAYLRAGLMAASLSLVAAIMLLWPPPQEAPESVSVVNILPGLTRGSSPQILDISTARKVVLIPAFFDIPQFDDYSFELTQGSKSIAAWDDIPASQLGQLNIMLPRSQLPAGEMSARLYGVKNSKRHLVQEYQLEVRYR